MATVEIDMSAFKPFFEKLRTAGNGDLKKEMSEWVEALGIELLRITEDEIIRRNVVDTRLLLVQVTIV